MNFSNLFNKLKNINKSFQFNKSDKTAKSSKSTLINNSKKANKFNETTKSKKRFFLFRFFLLLFLKIQRTCLRHAKAVIFLAIFIFVICFLQLGNLKIAVEPFELVNKNSPSYKHFIDMKSSFTYGDSLFFILKPKANAQWNEFGLAKRVQIWMDEEIKQNKNIKATKSLFHFRKPNTSDKALHWVRLWDYELGQPLSDLAKTPWVNLYTDSKLRDLGIEFVFDDEPKSEFQTRFDPLLVTKILASFKKAFPNFNSELDLNLGGTVAYQNAVFDGLQYKNLLYLFLIIFLMLIFRYLYGTWASGFIFWLTVIFSCIVVFGAMAFFRVPMDVLSSSLFLMTTVAALEDFLFLSLDQKLQKFSKNNSMYWRKKFRKLLLPSFFTSLTTVLGFGSLCISNLDIIFRFGLWTSISALLEWFVLFFILPCFLKVWPAVQIWTTIQSQLINPYLVKLLYFRPNKMGVLFLLGIAILGPLSVSKIPIWDNPQWMFSANHKYRQDLSEIKSGRGWESKLELVFTNSKHEKENNLIISQLKNNPLISKILNPYEVRDFYFRDQPLDVYSLIESDFRMASASQFLFSRFGETKATLFLNDTRSDRLDQLFAEINSYCNQDKFCYPAGDLEAFTEINKHILKTLLESLFVSVLLVALMLLILSWSLGQLDNLLYLYLSSFWGIAVMVGVLSLTQTPINFITCIFASVIVGLTGDNAVQFLFAGKKEIIDGVNQMGQASLLLAILVALSCSLYLFSRFAPENELAWLLALGFIFSTFGDVVILRSLKSSNSFF